MGFITFIVTIYNLLLALRLNSKLKLNSVLAQFTKNQLNAFINKCTYLVLREGNATTWRMHNIKTINVEQAKTNLLKHEIKLIKINSAVWLNKFCN
jgi:hypothetical protein